MSVVRHLMCLLAPYLVTLSSVVDLLECRLPDGGPELPDARPGDATQPGQV